MTLLAGETVLGHYEVIDQLGAGGMGAVYRARDTRLNRTVAIKTMLPGFATNREIVQRFEREAQAAATLKNPHITTIYDVGQLANGTHCMVMEYLPGKTLGQFVAAQGGRIAPELAVQLLVQVLDGISAAHAVGIIHRDLKPDNVLLMGDSRYVKVLDFGVAKLAEGAAGLKTRSGLVLGTPCFMSPEQLLAGKLDATADLYSIAVIAYLVTTGRFPYQEEATRDEFFDVPHAALILRMRGQPVPDARAIEPSLPEPWARALQRMLDPLPQNRPQHASDAARLLAGAVPNGDKLLERYAPDFAGDATAAPGASRIVMGEKLGEGGMAEVFRGTLTGAEGFARPVAIKRVHRNLAGNRRTSNAVISEARSLAQLQHPNIVSVLAFERTPDNTLLLVMDLVEGCDVDLLARAGNVPVAIAEIIALRVLRALAYAHARNIMHRDISARNILIGWNAEVKLGDFGLARAIRGGDEVSQTFRGTPRYMAPEAANGTGADRRADLWSVGVVLYELLTGAPLFGGQNVAETVAQVVARDIKPPHTVKGAGRIPGDIEAIAMRLLQRDPAARYRTADEVLADLAACEDVKAIGDHDGELARFLAARFPLSTRDSNRAVAPVDARATAVLSTLGSAASQSVPQRARPRSAVRPVAIAVGFCAAVGAGMWTVKIAHTQGRGVEVASAARDAVAAGATVAPHDTTVTAATRIGTSPAVAAPIATAPIATAPIATSPATAAPVAAAPIAAAPIAAAPIAAAPIAAAPIAAAPIAAAPTAEHRDHRAPAPLAVAAATGSLLVAIDPWADCYVDGRRIGSTPCRAVLPAGAHRVRLVNPSKRDVTRTVVITANKPTVIDESW